jgi:transposase
VYVKTTPLTREQCYSIYDRGREETVDFIQTLLPLINSIPAMQDLINSIPAMQEQIVSLSDKVEKLEARKQELESQKDKDSHNSHKPPSSDGLKRVIKPTRIKSNKSSGGQHGHKGSTLAMVEKPDHVVNHAVTECAACGITLKKVHAHVFHCRQEFDIPVVRMEVTEHRAEEKECPCCKSISVASFPHGITKAVQYGNRVKAKTLFFMQYQLVPNERLCETLKDLYDCNASEGTVHNWARGLYEDLQDSENAILERIRYSDVIHVDETGVYCLSKLQWLHVASTKKLTYYQMHPRRGQEAIDFIGILSNFNGTVIHDCWGPYFKYQINHGLCNAHILRELIFAAEEDKQPFARELKILLLKIKSVVNRARLHGRTTLSASTLQSYEKQYDECLALGYNDNQRNKKVAHKRGRVKQTKSFNLLERLRLYRDAILVFMYDFQIPFTNNLGERDIRMFKVRQKISGTFRSEQGAEIFCRIRGYISTARKNGMRVFEAILNALEGNPFMPEPLTR